MEWLVSVGGRLLADKKVVEAGVHILDGMASNEKHKADKCITESENFFRSILSGEVLYLNPDLLVRYDAVKYLIENKPLDEVIILQRWTDRD